MRNNIPRAGDDMSGEPSQLADLLADCNVHGIRLALADGGGLEVDAPQDALTPDLLARLKAHKGELLDMLKPAAEAADETEQVTQPNDNARGGDWPADVAAAADFALLLTPEDLPATPFDFGGPHGIVFDAAKFLRWLKADLRRGPAGPRAMYGAIQADLQRLRGMLLANTRHNG